jgi:hypothetical protein
VTALTKDCERCGEGYIGAGVLVAVFSEEMPDVARVTKRICPECDTSLRRWFLGAPVVAS